MKVHASRDAAEGSRLAHVIERLAAESPALARTRRARAGDGESLLVMLLREIDETVLPRRIVLLSQAGEVAQLAAANRRLTALRTGGRLASPQGADAGDPAAAARFYAMRLQALLDRPGRMAMRVDRKPIAADPDTVSCSARSLAASIGLALGPSAGSGEARDFLRAIEAMTLAWLYVGGKAGEERHRGPGDLVAGLQAFRGQARKAATASIRAVRPDCLVLPIPDGRALLRATAGDEQVLAVLPPDAVNPVMTTWQKVFATARV
ncbi:MAG: hypothetical protein KDJ98_06675 [Rhodobacteraceae bacterium]|nr:hypothetical protein [Paracoccaceae bacterium]